MKARLYLASAALALVSATTPASAAVYIVDAFANSINGGGGTGLTTISVTAGQTLSVSASTNDLWSAGALPRFSDANGLVGNRISTALDDSGQPIGTLIGIDFGLPTFNGFTAPFGALVGRIGTTYQLLGTSFNGPAWGTGALELFYWDSNFSDNTGSIAVDVASNVPEPAAWALLLAGFGVMGIAMRRRPNVRVSFS